MSADSFFVGFLVGLGLSYVVFTIMLGRIHREYQRIADEDRKYHLGRIDELAVDHHRRFAALRKTLGLPPQELQ